MSDRAALKLFFETNDIPSEGQYADFIDSVPNLPDDYGNAPQFTRSARITILSADVLTLFSSPVTLVAAPGANLAISPIDISVRFISNGTAYTGDTTVQVITNTANAISFSFSDLLEDTATTTKKLNPAFLFGTNVNQCPPDEPLLFRTGGSDPLTGDGDLIVFVTYLVYQF